MPVEIGLLIKKEYKRQGLSINEFGKSINRHPKTIANIFKRKTIDTQLLQSISKALNHDFFRYYYDEEPLKSLREFEMKEITAEIQQLKAEITLKDVSINIQNKYVQSQEDVIRLLKEKEQFLAT
jgi:IS30 family transposase